MPRLTAAAALIALLAPALAAHAQDDKPKPGRMRGMTMMKPVVCKTVPNAQGKTGDQLAQAIEMLALELNNANYRLTALLPGDPPIACFVGMGDPSKLPPGAR